jgi:DNA polymerase-3 subunit alpha
MAVLEASMDEAAAAQRERDRGQTSIFAEAACGEDAHGLTNASLPDIPEWDLTQMLKHERELTGFYITAHPLARYAPAIRRFSTAETDRLGELGDGKEVKVCGIINSVKPMVTKKGDRMAYFQLEDLQGLVEVIAFPDLFQTAGPLIVPESVVRVAGTVDRAEKGTRLKATRVESLTELSTRAVTRVNIRLREPLQGPETLRQLREVLRRHAGPTGMFFTFTLASRIEADTAPLPELTVLPSELFVAEVEDLLGKGTVALL